MLFVTVPINCANSKDTTAAEKEQAAEVVAKAESQPGANQAVASEQPAATEDEVTDISAKLKILSLGMDAPEVVVEDSSGNLVDMSRYAGKPLTIAFWDESCKLCMDQIKELETEIAAKDVAMTILAVTRNQGKKKNAENEKLLADNGVKARAVFDKSNKTGTNFRMGGIPFYALIDAKGKLRGAGSFLVKQKMHNITFLDMFTMVAEGKEVPPCEFAHLSIPADYKDLIGKPAPEFKLLDLDGNEQSPSFYKGFSGILLMFWGPTCPHCRAELPRVEYFNRTLAQKYNIKPIGVVGLPEKDHEDIMKYVSVTEQIVRQQQATFPITLDYGGKIREAYMVRGVPSMFLVGADGNVLHAWRGEALFAAEDIECVIKNLGSGK